MARKRTEKEPEQEPGEPNEGDSDEDELAELQMLIARYKLVNALSNREAAERIREITTA